MIFMVMANKNKIKYVSGNDILNGAITNNNVALGVDMDLDYGPTTGVNGTGFYQGVTPHKNGYTIYQLADGVEPKIVVAKDDEALIFFAKSFGASTTVDTVQEALNYFKNTSGYFVANRKFDSITTSGMTLMYDPGLTQSYPKAGTNMDNLGSMGAGTNNPQMNLYNTTFVNEKGGVLNYAAIGSSFGAISESTYLNDFTYNVWFKVNTVANNYAVLTSRNNDFLQLGMFANDPSGYYIEFFDDNTGLDIFDESGSPQIVPNKWYNATVVHIEGTSTKLYLDGVLIGTNTSIVNLYNENVNSFYIGGVDYNNGYSFDGQIGHVARYDRALSEAEVAKNYTALHNRYYGADRGETLLYMSGLVAGGNYGYVVLDAGTGMALGPFDTGISVNDFYEDDFYPLNHSGYAIEFRNHNDNNIRKVLFIDSFGTIVETADFNTGNRNFNDYEGRVVVFNDRNNGIIKYFDGITVGTYNYDTNNEEAYVDWNWDAASKDKTFVLHSKNTNTNELTWKLINTENQTVISLITYNPSDYDTEPILYFNGDFVVLPIYNYNTGAHERVDVFTTAGELVRREYVTGATYNSWSMEVYGTGKFSIIYYGNDNNVPYKILAYNETRNEFVSTTHTRGNNYNNFRTTSISYDWANNSYNCEEITYAFYDNTNWNGWANNLYYLDFVTLFENANSFTVNTFANNQSKWIQFNGYGSHYSDIIDNGDGVVKAMVILPTGITYTTLVSDVSTINYVDNWTCGNFNLYGVRTTSNTIDFHLINTQTGALVGSVTGISNNNWNLDYSNDSIVIGDSNNSQMWYFHRGANGFTNLQEHYDYRWTPSNMYTNDDTFTEEPYVTLFNPYGDMKMRIVSPAGISSQITLPNHNNNWSLDRGKDKISYFYRSDSNYPSVMVYDLSGNTLNDYSVSSDQSWNFWSNDAVGNITFLVSGEGNTNGTLNVTIVNNNGTTSYKTLNSYTANNNRYYNFNDYFWWDY